MRSVTGKPLETLLLERNVQLSASQATALLNIVARRLSGEPLQYILGQWSFMGLPFYCTTDALIPRQDTETLVEKAISAARHLQAKTLLDMCTGTGCIAVSMAKITGMTVHAADVSKNALSLALKNAAFNGVDISVIQSDMFANVKNAYDIITCDPPYIPSADIDALMPEVRDHEPRLALDGGADGLDFYWILAENAHEHIHKGGALIVETGAGQAASVCEIFDSAGFSNIETIKDLNGVERVVCARSADSRRI